ncbi:hypothetical protein BDY19DRAFT_908787 [Irpex rosettiformis]|uniref:Uncharacterized protein n=1 Tax=Irpex rosettiformis TaxID=378272 RepID=A0ACB8TV31_9APHY|nr:hypothetical protein BDY19DRAFT_908787 [Irpex rosettiformis]
MVLSIATSILGGLVLSAELVSCIAIGHVQGRAPYFPAIVTPTASSYWDIDRNAFVTWDASKVPSDADPIPWVQLYNTTEYGGPNYVATLASNFPAQSGKVTFKVPEVVPGSYFVMRESQFQDTPYSSAHFTIGSIYIPFSPVVISPTSSTVWKLGSQQTVVWSTSNIPEDADNLVYVDLYQTGDFGGPEFVATLVQDIPREQGSAEVTVPTDITPGNKYFLMVATWGNDSPQFTITE